MCVCVSSVGLGGGDAERDRLTSENEELRCALQRTEAAMKQTTQDAETSMAVMHTRCQVCSETDHTRCC